MQAAAGTGTVSWVAAQPSVLGRCGGAPVKGRAGAGGVGGGCRARGVGVPRCCARAQEKRPPRVRKSKEERREMVEAFINSYRVSHEGKFPSVNLTHKEVGGSYYIVREIVRDIIQENRVLGPGGLDSMALSFEDSPDSSESCMQHELGQANIEILNASGDSQVGKGSVPETPSTEESIPFQNNAISTQTLLGSSNILQAGVLNSVVQNGSAAGKIFFETNLEKQDEVPSGQSIEVDSNSSEEQVQSVAHVSDPDEVGHEGMASSATNRAIISSESNAVYGTNGALSREHETLSHDSHEGSADSGVGDANLLAATNAPLQAKQPSLLEHDASTESVSSDDAQGLDGQFSATASANPITVVTSEGETTAMTIEESKVHRLQDKLEQPSLDTSCDGQENTNSPVSHPALDMKGMLHTKHQHSVVHVDENELRKSGPRIKKEGVEGTDTRHEEGISTPTAISRHALCLLTLRCMLTVYNFLHTSQKATLY
ncbi:hypothetical protein BS78_08G084300 [Paspalum vaginatum]|nr:hypothetical protein BS78_08G084300 [Paspalum vaginatum]